ncbi:MAG TPA: hypothetical protein VIG64_11315 [Actinomycetota bacterium]|jgi:hypothetical protein
MLLAHQHPEGGGAPIEDLIPATIVALVLVVLLAVFARLHLGGRVRILNWGAGIAERVTGLPGWAALPVGVAAGSLLAAVFGFYWDVASHIDNGRDPGPFANPSHYFIIVGLAGIAFAGYLSLLLGRDDGSGVRIGARRVPLGGVLLSVCGVIALLGFPLDDTWHRLFGEDVTLWGPTHLQMVGGAALSTLAIWILLVEAKNARAAGDVRGSSLGRFDEIFAAGGFLVGLSAFQAEFDYSMPQFRLLYQPVLLMFAAGLALVAARIRLGRGGALGAVAVFLAIRGVLAVAVGPGLEHTMPHFPLYVVEAIAVELVAVRVSTSRQLAFGAWSGAAIGTAGLAAEWGWSYLWMSFPWPPAMMVQGALFGLAAAVAAGVAGGFVGRALTAPEAQRQHGRRWIGVVTAASLLLVLFFPLPIATDTGASVSVTLAQARNGPGEWVHATVTPAPASVIDDPEWFNVSAWQGGGSVVSQLEPVGDGSYRTVEPVPIYGEWKTLIRLHQGPAIVAAPIYMPSDPAIGASAIPAEPSFTRAFVEDKKLLLREAKDTDAWLSYVAYTVLVGIVLCWVLTLGWGLWRLERTGLGSRTSRPRSRGRSKPAVITG